MIDHTIPTPGQQAQPLSPTINARQETMMVYIAFAVAIFFGFFATLIGVMYAYVRRNDIKDTVYYSHMNYLIRLFWWQLVLVLVGCAGLIYGLVRFLRFDQAPNMTLFFAVIIWFALVTLWFLVRMVLGFIRFNDARPIKVPLI